MKVLTNMSNTSVIQEKFNTGKFLLKSLLYLEDPRSSLRAILNEVSLHLDTLPLQVVTPPHGLQPVR